MIRRTDLLTALGLAEKTLRKAVSVEPPPGHWHAFMLAALVGRDAVWAKHAIYFQIPNTLQPVRVRHRLFRCLVVSREDLATYLLDTRYHTLWDPDQATYPQHARLLRLINPGYLTIQQAADRLSVSPGTVRLYVQLGHLVPDAGTGKGRCRWGFLEESLARFQMPEDRRLLPHPKLTRSEILMIHKYRAKGMTRAQIGLAIHRSESIVGKVIRREGRFKGKKRGRPPGSTRRPGQDQAATADRMGAGNGLVPAAHHSGSGHHRGSGRRQHDPGRSDAVSH